MTAIANYSTGTVSVTDGGTTVTGTTTIWSASNALPGDVLQIGEFQTIITDVTDTTHLVIPPWGGGDQTDQAYKIHHLSPQRFSNFEIGAMVGEVFTALQTDGFFHFVDTDETEPDPSLGEDGQYAMQPSTGKVWLKDSGTWEFEGVYKAFRLTGAYSGATTYSLGDVATDAGSSYVWMNETPGSGHAPPNVTYWQLLAAKGDTGVTAGIRQTYSTTTTDSDPGNGTFRLNNATPASATAAYLDNLDAAGATVSGLFDLFDDSTTTTKGYLRIQKAADPAVWAQFAVTGSVVDGTGYRKLTLSSGAGSGSFTNGDSFSITFYRSGDKGADGAGYGGTSTTSLAIGTGSKVFTTQAGLAYTNGARVRASSAANAANWMEGVVTYSGTTLTMTSSKTGGSGTHADWNLNVTGEPGAGDLLASNALSELTGSASTARDNIGAAGTTRTVSVLTSGTGATYNVPAGCKAISILAIGGGGGGAAGNHSSGGSAGGDTTFSGGSLTAGGGGAGGGGGPFSFPGTGGSASGGNIINIAGNSGHTGVYTVGSNNASGGAGGGGPLGGAGRGNNASTGTAGATNSGSGGGGGGITNPTTAYSGAGGGAGGTVRHLISSPSSSYTYTIGAGGSGGTAGTGGSAGAAGGSGVIIIEEFY